MRDLELYTLWEVSLYLSWKGLVVYFWLCGEREVGWNEAWGRFALLVDGVRDEVWEDGFAELRRLGYIRGSEKDGFRFCYSRFEEENNSS